MSQSHTAENDALAEALASLAPLVRQGLMGVNVPAGMTDLNVALASTDPAVAGAKDEHVRRALSWVAHAHPDAVRAAFASITSPEVEPTP